MQNYPFCDEFYSECKKEFGSVPVIGSYITKSLDRTYLTSKGNITISAIETAKGWMWKYKDDLSGIFGEGYSLDESRQNFDNQLP